MKSSSRIVVGLIIALAGLYFLRPFIFPTDLERKVKIISEVRPLIDECKKRALPFSIRGRILVWNLDSNVPMYVNIPKELEASAQDKCITVFMVQPYRYESVGKYEISRQNAYRQEIAVYVVYWPEKQVVGSYFVTSSDPPNSRYATDSPEFGKYHDVIGKWITSHEITK